MLDWKKGYKKKMWNREFYTSTGENPMRDTTFETRLREAGYIEDDGQFRKQLGPFILCFVLTSDKIGINVLHITPQGNLPINDFFFSQGFYAEPIEMFEHAIMEFYKALFGAGEIPL